MLHQALFAGAIVMLPRGAGASPPAFTVSETATSLIIRSSDPDTFVIGAAPGRHAGELVLTVDKGDDGDPEFGSSLATGTWNDGLAGRYQKSCKARGFVAEFESVRLLPTPPAEPQELRKRERDRWRREVRDPWMDGIPYVLVEQYDDGNVHIVLDADRDGTPEAEATTDFVLLEPARSEFCVKAMPIRPGLPRPPEPV